MTPKVVRPKGFLIKPKGEGFESMFTGLVETRGKVTQVASAGPGKRLTIDADFVADGTQLGDSIALNGCCLTVVEISGKLLSFEAGPETLAKTNLGGFEAGHDVNLERSMRADGRLGGHIVQGHVDGTGYLLRRQREGDWEFLQFHAGELAGQMVPKGSVTVDGVSLTVVDVTGDSFSVALIPHTLEVTTLGTLREGSLVNLETDILGKYVMKYLSQLAGSWKPGGTP